MNSRSSTDRALYLTNVHTMFLCALMAFWLLVSPLVPYTFDVSTTIGLVLFVGIHLLLTTMVGSIGVLLNGWAARGVRLTPALVRAKLSLVRVALRRGRRR